MPLFGFQELEVINSIVLMRNTVQVWQISLQGFASKSDELIRYYRACLSPDEKDKADRFRFPEDRRRFTIARGTLRHLLSHQLNQNPQDVVFCYGKYGKPSVAAVGSQANETRTSFHSLAEAGCEFHFNLSHSGEMALCALGYERSVGVDVEAVKPIKRLDGLMKRTLVAEEQRQVAMVTAAAQPREFLQRWTCKEAYLKAIGLGLAQPMQTVEVCLSPPQFLQVPESCLEGWHLHVVSLPEGYVGALAIAGKAEITQHHWQHDLLSI